MGLSKADFHDRDIFIDYDFEEVMFRFEHTTQRFFRRFYDKSEEVEVPFDNGLLNEAILYGVETGAKTYWEGNRTGPGMGSTPDQ